tara:strand:- start:457 stop:1194 length:738 start_codon:yes stop_codon:yes gene_type:complete
MAIFLAAPIAYSVALNIARIGVTAATKQYSKKIPKFIIETLAKNKKLLTKNKKGNLDFDPKAKIKVNKQLDAIKKNNVTKKKDIKPINKDLKSSVKKKTKIEKVTGPITGNTIYKNMAKEVKQLSNIVNKLTLGTGPALKKSLVKRPLTTLGGGYAGYKAVDMGTKLFSGGGSNKKSETDVTNEVTGNGSTNNKTTTQVGGTGGTGGTDVNDFVAAHNAALDGGQQIFRFDGKAFSVGKTRMSDF